METKNPEIIIIDDNMSETDPLIVEINLQLKIKPTLFKKSAEGLNYVLNNLNHSMIVIIDYNFPAREIQGYDVLKSIREQTSLVSIIMLTSCPPNDIEYDRLVEMINYDAFAFIDRTMDNKEKVRIINNALHSLCARVDSILEKWMLNQSQHDNTIPYLTTSDGNSYSLNDVVCEVRKRTELGKKLERNIIYLAIDLLIRGKEKI